MSIRQAAAQDASRVAEIFVFNNRVNFYPIFRDDGYSFGELQVMSVAGEFLLDKKGLSSTFVYDDGVVRGFIRVEDGEIRRLFVDPFFQGRGIGAELLEFAVTRHNANRLWALEKNTRAIKFYEAHGFRVTGEKTLEEGTAEYLVRLAR